MDKATVDIYERHARDWEDRRPVKAVVLAQAQRLGASARPGVRVDLGCGPGRYTAALGEPVVALDAARAMLDRAGAVAPEALRVQADLEALPFRDCALSAAWASASYVHVPKQRVPQALARLHWALAPGALVRLVLFSGEGEIRSFPDDDFPGRFFSAWTARQLRDVLDGAGFDRVRVSARRGSGRDWLSVGGRRARSLPDTVGPGMRLLICGLNPSEVAADAGYGYAGRSNRFWPAALDAGLVTTPRDPLRALVVDGVGMTDLVKGATARSSALTSDHYRRGAARVERLVRWLRPNAVAFVGLEGWRAAVDRRARPGLQPAGFAGRPAYVLPSTSGLNARVSRAELARHLAAAAQVAADSSDP